MAKIKARFLLLVFLGTVFTVFLLIKPSNDNKGDQLEHANRTHLMVVSNTSNSTRKAPIVNMRETSSRDDIVHTAPNVVYTIAWHNKEKWNLEFRSCEYSNCKKCLGRECLSFSDAVLFDGRNIKPEDFFERKQGQIWVFYALEAPITFMDLGGHWTRGDWVSSFNWTMTYDRSNTDIYLPVGEIAKKTNTTVKDFKGIFKNKNKTALIVHSHCPTRARREEFVSKLEKYLEFDSFGKCGTPWACGRYGFPHEVCFNIVNDYKFYFAFENAFCHQYFTEKLFANFNYDSIMVVRGGRNNEIKQKVPEGTYISTDDFDSIKSLADYLTKLANSESMYTEMLERKSQYYSVPRTLITQRGYCALCERLNKQDQYRQQIPNITDWVYRSSPCKQSTEVTDLNET